MAVGLENECDIPTLYNTKRSPDSPPMNTETETKVAQALDTVIAPYQRELMALSPG